MTKDEALATDDPYIVYRYARHAQPLCITSLQAAVCKLAKPQPILWFSEDIPGADLELLGEAMRKTNDAYYIQVFLKRFKISASLRTKLEKQLTIALLVTPSSEIKFDGT